MSITRLQTNSLGGILRATYSSYTGSASVTTVSGKTCVQFLTSGTITIDRAGLVWALVVAGGGGAGFTTYTGTTNWNDMSGGGAGGQAIEVTDFFLPVGIATVTVGGGGPATPFGGTPVSGNASRLANLAAIGGGSTGNYGAQPMLAGNSAGAGGFWYSFSGNSNYGGGIAQPITITGIGYVGGVKSGTFNNNAGGGAGAGGNGSNGSGNTGGAGGVGYYSSITGSSVAYGGGGGGGGSTASTGGAGGGGSGSASPTAGSINTGGGGGGRWGDTSTSGASGGSGIVIILFG